MGEAESASADDTSFVRAWSTAIGVDSLNANTAPDRIFDHNLIEQPSSREITYPTGNYLRAFGTWSSAFTGYSVTDSTAVASDTGLVGVDVSLLPQF